MAATKQSKKKNPQSKWTIVRRVNVLFRRASREGVLTFLLFVLIAAFFWTVQTAREESSEEFEVELLIEDQPQDRVFTTRVPSTLKVTLVDTNARLFNYRYNQAMEELKVDFERYADVSGNFRISAAELQSLLRSELKSTTKITAMSPSLIDARFAQTEGRKFEVRLRNDYRLADNYRMHEIVIEPDSVTINAPTAVLDTLQWVWAQEKVVPELLRDTLYETLTLELPLGVKATPNHVHVIVPVSQYVEKVFEQVVLQTTGVPANKQLVVFPYAVKVSCLVDFECYRDLHEEDFEVTVNYGDIGRPTTDDGQPIPANKLPIEVHFGGDREAVTNIKVEPAWAEYVVEPAPMK